MPPTNNMPRPPSFAKLQSAATSRTAPIVFSFLLLAGAFVSARWINTTLLYNTADNTQAASTENLEPNQPMNVSIPFTCPSRINKAKSCKSTTSQPSHHSLQHPRKHFAAPTCPDYFRWIHEDLRPWKSTGIRRDMVARAARTANFRLVVLDGCAYVESYRRAFQTRDVFTIWGILQLLRRYPGRIPDLDLMFDCLDWPAVHASDYKGERAPSPPPLFTYCGNDSTLDIVFPDWSFWGWPEVNLKPWEALSKELKEGNQRMKWADRQPYAYWKGNPAVAARRQDLLRCNVSEGQDWNARIYRQNWSSEVKKGFRESDLSSQCVHRYKIYIEGATWSVSEKYILACDSMSLVVNPVYYDFFTRGVMPLHHYWPIRDDDKCRSIKYAVDWGNSHKQEAQAIGREASRFIQEELKLDRVYEYMFHLLNEYAKLLKYKPTIPRKAVRVCAESMACRAKGLQRKFMMESMINLTSSTSPCSLPPPYTALELGMIQKRNENNVKQVEMWKQRDLEIQGNKQL